MSITRILLDFKVLENASTKKIKVETFVDFAV